MQADDANWLPVGDPTAPALVGDTGTIDYRELAARVGERKAALGSTRRLVMVTAANTVEPVITLLAALAGGHPVLLVAEPRGEHAATAAAHRDALIATFDPDVVTHGREDAWSIEHRRVGTAHSLHPELALLASTSGSTGSPKLARISHAGLRSNALAIAEYLSITASDRAATTLPLQYCYGLSVVTSHLASGASLILTEHSVSEPAFWAQLAEHRATSFAGVPYTFELLEAAGVSAALDRGDLRLPSLRQLTQAGGKMPPERIRSVAALGERHGFELVVMYGQTEATARMAYVPPHLTASAAGAIGVPIPGGELRVDAPDAAGVGELVYRGANVMLGYATRPADLALGREIDELRTGDRARQRADGMFEVVGRASRFVKVFGERIDLDRIERLFADAGLPVTATADDERLVLAVAHERDTARATQLAQQQAGIPPHAVDVLALEAVPRTANGKVDHAALARHARLVRETASAAPSELGTVDAAAVRDVLATLLGRPDATTQDSFTSLGGDSLAFVEVSVRLEAMLGTLPSGWASRSAESLASAHSSTADAPSGVLPAARQRRRIARVDTAVVLRAAAIVVIVATHADLITLQGGAHLLLAVVGCNLARFQLAPVPGLPRVRALVRTAARVAVPATLWIGAVALVTGQYAPTTALLINGWMPSDGFWNEQWQFWFLEAIVWATLGLAGLMAMPWVRRAESAKPFAFALGALGATLALRFALTGIEAEHVQRYAVPFVLWCIALGWAIARASTTRSHALLSVVAIAATAGFLGDPLREAVVIAGLLTLIWWQQIPLPRAVVPAVSWLAGASLWIYLTHWQVYPAWEESSPLVGTVLSLAVGILVWRAERLVAGAVARWRARPAVPADGEASPHPSVRTPSAASAMKIDDATATSSARRS